VNTVNIYLIFKGNCRAAFEFYRSIFGGEYSKLSTFGDMPPMQGMPTLSETQKQEILHVSLPISKETVLMGSDAGEKASETTIGNNFAISVNTDNRAETERIYHALSSGGKVTMPLAVTFWGEYFGMLTDQFGINWMVNSAVSS
jgi:PhnB protein